MQKFIFFIWLQWFLKLNIKSIFISFVITIALLFVFYFQANSPSLENEVYKALYNIFQFFFPILFAFSFLISFIYSTSDIFNKEYFNYRLHFQNCKKEVVQNFKLKHKIKVWRKWLFLSIWITAMQITLIVVIRFIFNLPLANWISIIWIYILFTFATLITLPILISKAKFIKVVTLKTK